MNYLLKPSIVFLALVFGLTAPFNLHSQSGWTITADFEEGTLDEEAEGNASSFSDAFSNSVYSNVQVHSGSQAAEMSITQGETGFGQWGGMFRFPSVLKEGDEIWFRTYLYFPTDFPFQAAPGFLKCMRIHTASASGDNEGYLGALIYNTGSHISIVSEVTEDWYRNNSDWRTNGGQVPHNEWHAIEQYIKFSSVPGEGITRVWQNGILFKEETTTNTLRSATSVSDFIYLFTYWNGGAPATVKAYVDDVIITSQTPANTDADGNPYIGLATTLSTEDVTNEFENSTLVYPNPFSDDVSIDLGETFSEINAKIHSVDGKLIQENTFNNTNEIALKLNAKAGVYFITVYAQEKKAVFKVVKK